jgi:hypothetical protein
MNPPPKTKTILMNKFLSPTRPVVTFFVLFALLLGCALSGCNPNGAGGGAPTPYNVDTVRNHVIPIDSAIELTHSFGRAVDSFNRICTTLKDSLRFSHAEEFPADVFQALLAEKDPKQGPAKGIRIYYGRGRDGMIKLVMVPVDSLGNDMIEHIVDLREGVAAGGNQAQALKVSNGQAVEQGQHCPPLCDDGGSGLNP